MYENLAILAIFAFVFSVIAGKVERGIIGGPIIFIGFGLLAGPMGVGLLDFSVNNAQLRVIADLTLALVLFIDAANADLSVLGSHSKIPQRMLIVGLPLCIALGVVCGLVLFPGVSLFELCVLATMLAATDAALGKAVVTNKAVPARVREGLNAESGLNDGLCVPILFVFLALAAGSVGEEGGTALALKLVAKEIGIGLVVGLGLTALGAGLIAFCWRRGWMTEICYRFQSWCWPLPASPAPRVSMAAVTLPPLSVACYSVIWPNQKPISWCLQPKVPQSCWRWSPGSFLVPL